MTPERGPDYEFEERREYDPLKRKLIAGAVTAIISIVVGTLVIIGYFETRVRETSESRMKAAYAYSWIQNNGDLTIRLQTVEEKCKRFEASSDLLIKVDAKLDMVLSKIDDVEKRVFRMERKIDSDRARNGYGRTD